MDDALADLLELRVQARGSPRALARIDRGLLLLAAGPGAGRVRGSALEAELSALLDALARQFERRGPSPRRRRG